MGEDLECLCQIMRTVGPRLDHEKAKVKDWVPIFPILVNANYLKLAFSLEPEK